MLSSSLITLKKKRQQRNSVELEHEEARDTHGDSLVVGRSFHFRGQLKAKLVAGQQLLH